MVTSPPAPLSVERGWGEIKIKLIKILRIEHI
jgi:hypothetical protein